MADTKLVERMVQESVTALQSYSWYAVADQTDWRERIVGIVAPVALRVVEEARHSYGYEMSTVDDEFARLTARIAELELRCYDEQQTVKRFAVRVQELERHRAQDHALFDEANTERYTLKAKVQERLRRDSLSPIVDENERLRKRLADLQAGLRETIDFVANMDDACEQEDCTNKSVLTRLRTLLEEK